MASLDVATAVRTPDWTAVPWPLMGAGVALCLLALAATRYFGTEPELARLLLLSCGLLCAGISVALRLNSTGPAALERVAGSSRPLLLFLLANLFVVLVVAATTIVVLTFYEFSWLPWGTGTALVLWLVVAPLGSATAYRVFRLSRQGGAITPQEEASALLFLASLCGFATCWALYHHNPLDDPGDPETMRGSWDTMRLALAVFSSIVLIASPMPLASVRVRRWTVSVLVVLHFTAIASATLAAPPASWLVGQLWFRVYRPYLEFMYLNNAYHFYSPEPGPPSYLWCRLLYVDPQGNEWGEWYKLPDIDDAGRHHHAVALEYQRYLALTEQVVHSEVTPPFMAFNADGTEGPAPFARRRHEFAPQGPEDTIGKERPKLIVPYHPFLHRTMQYSLPTGAAQRLLKSYARHVARAKEEPPPHLEGCTLRWVKIYRVRHEIPPVDYYAKLDPPLSANDPELYRPFYMGRYDKDGELTDGPGPLGTGGDPFLYWLLPVIRDSLGDQRSPIRDYARQHAGDPKWIYLPDEKEWVDERHLGAPRK